MIFFDDHKRHLRRRQWLIKRNRISASFYERCEVCRRPDVKLEMHHYAGSKFSARSVPLCRDCHDKLSYCQWAEHPPVPEPPWDNLQVFAREMLGLCDLQEAINAEIRSIILKHLQFEGDYEKNETDK